MFCLPFLGNILFYGIFVFVKFLFSKICKLLSLLQFSAKKCVLFQNKVHFLHFFMFYQNKELITLLDLCSYLWRFLKYFGKIATSPYSFPNGHHNINQPWIPLRDVYTRLLFYIFSKKSRPLHPLCKCFSKLHRSRSVLCQYEKLPCSNEGSRTILFILIWQKNSTKNW